MAENPVLEAVWDRIKTPIWEANLEDDFSTRLSVNLIIVMR